MRTVQEFMDTMNGYFDGIKNRTVASLIVQELSYIKPGDLDSLFRQLTISQPASWKPDLKAIVEAIKQAKITPLDDPSSERQCEVCGTLNRSTGVCPTCCYDETKDGTPEEHRAWFERWKSGLEPRFNIGDIMKKLEVKTIPFDNSVTKGVIS